MEIKVQVTLKGEVAEKFAASMERNYRSIAGEAAFWIAESFAGEESCGAEAATVERQKEAV